MCNDVSREIEQHDDDLVKLRERLRDSVKEITGSLHVDDMEHARLLMQETLAGYENLLKGRRQELQDLRGQAEAAKKRDDIYARIETSLLRMFVSNMFLAYSALIATIAIIIHAFCVQVRSFDAVPSSRRHKEEIGRI